MKDTRNRYDLTKTINRHNTVISLRDLNLDGLVTGDKMTLTNQDDSDKMVILVIGETPSLNLLAWRLSVEDTFVILISSYVSKDGFIIWCDEENIGYKYTPDSYFESINDFISHHSIEDSNSRVTIDILIVSGMSPPLLQRNVSKLKPFITKKTTVLVSSDFGCELEPVVINIFEGTVKFVYSILTDIKFKSFAKGMITLLNVGAYDIYIGLSYQKNNYNENKLVTRNVIEGLTELEFIDNEPVFESMVSKLRKTDWLTVDIISDCQSMANIVWDTIIPKIALTVLSCVFKQYDITNVLQNPSIEGIYNDLVKELSLIRLFSLNKCKTSGSSRFASPSPTPIPKSETLYQNFIENEMKYNRNDPNYTWLPFEAYCFYHRIDYPSQLLLQQPLDLARRHNIQCPNLNYLHELYSRIISFQKSDTNRRKPGYQSQSPASAIETNINRCSLDVIEEESESIHQIEFMELNSNSASTNGESMDSDLEQLIIEHHLSGINPIQSKRKLWTKVKRRKPIIKYPSTLRDSIHFVGSELEYLQSQLIKETPPSVKKYSNNKTRNFECSSPQAKTPYHNHFECKLRDNLDSITKEYKQILERIYLLNDGRNFMDTNATKQQFVTLELDLWKLKYQCTSYREQIFNPISPQLEEDYILPQVLSDDRFQIRESLNFTTDRYADNDCLVTFYEKLDSAKPHTK
ncbi:hypothetical protein Kpol_1058p25 [Vanderwaltozyma polyspora DSM 70294]|uniref:Uncharacterized protein n=1 Tax=Vanderwaltozyma polyspora (strain ATCC 22028 / DSM 70294 / BCRC 21397 / CBS 2163 / NBRC 10782 / NRRL Y-8283 / UCD 57-17) TaxID=436907 RepID=A7TJQ9_VANPO|nr:uncharacterized protein Kpol_1058p25 [Vanderwaltozyma polyspora DSM 70294]EDO17488.1 hypothetical protein Kpol_1058p25 [Vanderwaltozyma polyspora DSM 70294]